MKRLTTSLRRGEAALARGLGSDRLAGIRRAVKRFVEAGTQGYRPDIKRRLVVCNLIAYLIAFTTAGYAIQHSYLDAHLYAPVIGLNLALLVISCLVPFSHRLGDMAAGFIIIGSEYVGLLVFSAYFGHTSGLHLQYFIAAAAIFVVFGVKRWRLIVPLVALAVALHLYVWFSFPKEAARIDTPPEILNGIYTQAAITTGALIAAAIYYAFSLAEAAKAETDALLRNILPDDVVERLKAAPGKGIADSVEEASILFADISGFVALSRQLGAERIVALLNRIVSEFDWLAEKHGVEKIKTIGDAYMVAAGVPQPVTDHAVRIARMGCAMLEAVKRIREETGHDIRMRIGVASGPVTAGVIGTTKFSYDLWGDAVNLAARLENRSQPGRILVCPACRAAIGTAFEFEHNGAIDIKGVGLKETWFLVGERRGGSADETAVKPEKVQAVARP